MHRIAITRRELLAAALAAPLVATTARAAVQPATPAPSRGGWAQYRGGPARTGGVTGQSGPAAVPQQRWLAELDGKPSDIAPTVSSDAVFTGTQKGVIQSFDRDTGQERWRTDLGGQTATSPALGDNLVFCRVTNTGLVALEQMTGAVAWTIEGSFWQWHNPLLAEGVLCLADNKPIYHAYDAATGAPRWEVELAGTVSRSSAYADGLIAVGLNEGGFVALDAESGKQVWQAPAEASGRTHTTPAIADGTVFTTSTATTNGGSLIAYDLKTGAERWRVDDTKLIRVATVASGVVMVLTTGKNAIGYDSGNGELMWTTLLPGPLEFASSHDDRRFYVSCQDGNLYALDQQDGSIVWSLKTKGIPGPSMPVIDGTVYVAAGAKNLQAFA